jgi:hypothetical protein
MCDELLRNLAACIRERPDPRVHVVTGIELAEDEPAALAAATPHTAGAEVVEPSGRIDPVPVGDAEPGRFTCFMDGIQRQRVVLYFDGTPVVYGYTAAVVRSRGPDKRMRTHAPPTVREALYYPKKLVDLQLDGIDSIDTDDGEKPVEEHPMIFLDAARKRISNVRERLEARVTSEWLAASDNSGEWLLVDGSLAGDYDHYAEPNAVGVVKSHQTQYFPMEEQRKVLGLRVGERSGVFIPRGRRRSEVYSWYLRLRPNDGQDVHFGLVRIEGAKCERTLTMADEISRWLLAERSPLSLPDSRWDRMIYPIRDCEQYLGSLAPTRIALDAAAIRLAGTRSL